MEVIQEFDDKDIIQIGLSSTIERADKGLNNEIKETNIKLENHCLVKAFIFVDLIT